MANMQERLDTAVLTAEETTQKFYQVVHGKNNETISVNSGEIPTVAKALKDIRESISTGCNDIVAKATQAKEIAVNAQELILNNPGFQIVSADLLNENNISITAQNVADINIVANISESVNKVADIDTEIVTASQNIDNIKIASENIANINLTASNIANINAVANNEINVNKVSANKDNIDIVASNIADIITTSEIAEDISRTSQIISEITTITEIKNSIEAVANNMEDVENAAENAILAKTSAESAKNSEIAAEKSAQQAATLANLDNASETLRGVVMLATAEDADNGENDLKAMTPAKVRRVVNGIDFSPYQIKDNLSQFIDNSQSKYPSNYAVNVAMNAVITGLDLFDFKWSDHLLNNEIWLRSDTFSWQDGTKYTAAYEHLVADIVDAVIMTETIGTIEITYYLATDGHKICLADQEDNLFNLYMESGIAWYYLLDQENIRFKLPRTKYGFVSFRDMVGNYVYESLPNFQQDIGYTGTQGNGDPDGGGDSGGRCYPRYSGNVVKIVDPATVNPVYQTNAPVQQRSTQMFLYFFVGKFTENPEDALVSSDSISTLQYYGIQAETLNNKVDLDLSNVNPSQPFIDSVIRWGSPDFSKQYTSSESSVAIQENSEIYITGELQSNQTGEIYADGVIVLSVSNSSSIMEFVETSRFKVVKNTTVSVSGFIENSTTIHIIPLIGV